MMSSGLWMRCATARVLLDTNVILSALLSPNGIPAKCASIASEKYTLVLCDHVIAELREVVNRKLPHLLPALEEFLAQLPYEPVETPSENVGAPQMGDPKDSPILAAAIAANADILVSGDHHFLDLAIAKPKIMSPKEFWETFG